MKDLENKGIYWSGNIYHKFEGIIPDVHEMMIQDTFKYVENRVHNVGGNFRKFCSDVVQELFPLSEDSAEHEAKTVDPEGKSVISTGYCCNSEISVMETSSCSVVKKPTVVTEVIDHAGQKLGLVSTGNDTADELHNAKSTGSCEVQDSILAPPRMNESADENADRSKKGVDDAAESVDEPLGASFHDELIDTDHEDKIFVAVHSFPRDCTSPPRYSSDISSPEALDHHVFVLNECVTDSPNELLSPIASSAIPTEDGVEEREIVSSISHLSLESIDDSRVNVVAGSGMETINLQDEANLGKSCVLVDDAMLYAVSRRARKLGSYKKKIQDIFAPKKRLAKEYEQLAIWYGDTDIDSSPDSQNSQSRQLCDSEWELL